MSGCRISKLSLVRRLYRTSTNGLTPEQHFYIQIASSNMICCSRNIIFIIFSGQSREGNELIACENRIYERISCINSRLPCYLRPIQVERVGTSEWIISLIQFNLVPLSQGKSNFCSYSIFLTQAIIANYLQVEVLG